MNDRKDRYVWEPDTIKVTPSDDKPKEDDKTSEEKPSADGGKDDKVDKRF